MLKNRLVGVITVKNGWAVQSFGYQRYLPLGKPECMVENLDRWGADEIIVQVIDRSTSRKGPDFQLLKKLGDIGLGTPLIYAGGIRSVADGVKVIQMGADRLVVDAIMHDDLDKVRELSEKLGAQALIASLPLKFHKNNLELLNYRDMTSSLISGEILKLIDSGVFSEAFITDWMNEGSSNGFNHKIIEKFPLKNVPIIAFGGLNDFKKIRVLLRSSNVVAVALGNFLSYQEHSIQKYKVKLQDMPFRKATYYSMYSLISNT